MREYLVCFKPIEPYFFGNEKIFSFSQNEGNRYYIKGENVPSQSTLLGAIRYLLLPVKKADWSYSEAETQENNRVIGTSGFHPENTPKYGMIKKISQVFITGANGALIRTPFDHIEGKPFYAPFSDYLKTNTSCGEKSYPTEYNTKDGLTDSYMQLCNGKIIASSELFISDTRIGINRFDTERGFFKKEYKRLSNGYSFSVYLTLDKSITPQNGIVHLGQGKSTFLATFTEQKNTLEGSIKEYLRDDVIYCAGDTFCSSEVYQHALFSATKTKTYRHFSRQGNSVRKDNTTLYHILEAGSILIPSDKETLTNMLTNENINKAGYNTIICK